MKTRAMLAVSVALAVLIASSQGNLAAVYVALAAGAIIYLLHAIELKINKLLNDRGIYVVDQDIAKD